MNLKWFILPLINLLTRSQICLFFSSFTPSTSVSLSFFFQIIALFLLPFASFKLIILPRHTHGVFHFKFRIGFTDGWSLPFTSSLIFSLLTATPVFLSSYSLIFLLLSLRRFLLRPVFPSLNSPTILPITISSSSQELCLFYYDIRWILLLAINTSLRPHLTIIFSDYMNFPLRNLFLYSLITSLLLIFLFVSFKMCLFVEHDLDGVVFIYLQINYRHGWSLLMTGSLIFSVLCPTPVFLYMHPCLIFVSLWPSFFVNLLHSFLLCLKTASTALLELIAPPSATARER